MMLSSGLEVMRVRSWGEGGRLAGGSQKGLRFQSNQPPLVPSDALSVRTVTVTRRTWGSTVTSAR